MTRYIFMTGGVASSLGKGLATAALGALLQAHGYSVRLRKLDPYLNVDPGTMSPTEHGEVFVTDDGAETDLDLGHYERFSGVHCNAQDNITSGRIYSNLISKERRGEFLGKDVRVVPHVTDEIKNFVHLADGTADFIICEIGGTVGDMEIMPFLEAIRQFGNELDRDRVLYIHMTLLPQITTTHEYKTKPTQHSVYELLSYGIQPGILMCRADRVLSEGEKKKISLYCNLREYQVVSAPDAKSIYQVPLTYHDEGLDRAVLDYFGLPTDKAPDLSKWDYIVDTVQNPEGAVTIAVVGKYVSLLDSYKSLIEALVHGGIANKTKVNIIWVDAEKLEQGDTSPLHEAQGILVPGGFGERGTLGKIKAIEYARKSNTPFFGICFGMQMAVIETARHLCGMAQANTSEITPQGLQNVVGLMTEWVKEGSTEMRAVSGDLGGTMRLGAYPCALKAGSLAEKIYSPRPLEGEGQGEGEGVVIKERHRHRYEVNTNYQTQLESQGLVFSGMSPDGKLPEIVERPDHPFFIGVQFHPELKSKPFAPHPIFTAFIKAARAQV